MRKILLTAVGALLIAASTAQLASAAESRHVYKAHVTTNRQFRNANDAIAAPATSSPNLSNGVDIRSWSGTLGHQEP